ncbi:MAG: TIGR02757 family protein [Bacteroidota bacterium]
MAKRNALRRISDQNLSKLKPLLDRIGKTVEVSSYIERDPVLFMHAYEDQNDMALAGFFAAIMAWGRRDIVINKVEDLLERMNHQPAAFIGHYSERDRAVWQGFKHRTFKPIDVHWLVKNLQAHLHRFGTFEQFWAHCYQQAQIHNRPLMSVFHHKFFAPYPETPKRTYKHISNVDKNSSCKRLYLYLRWCIRKESPVDPGIMNFMDPAELYIPLDVHVARHARRMGLLTRKSNDWKAVVELTSRLRQLKPEDPSWYDYALFGLGIGDYELPNQFKINAFHRFN